MGAPFIFVIAAWFLMAIPMAPFALINIIYHQIPNIF